MSDKPSRSRRSIAVSREGWYFLFILTFIVFGSVLRQMNLLFLLAGLLICPLILNWRFAMTSIFFVSVKRHVPRVTNAGQVTFVEMEINNSHPRITCWSLVVRDRIRRYLAQPTGAQPTEAQPDAQSVSGEQHQNLEERVSTENEEIEVIAAQVPPGGTVSVSYRCFFSERGKYEFGHSTVSSSFPVGLVKASFHSLDQSTVYVGPPLGQLTPVWHRRMQSMVAGSQANQRRRGIEQDEFYGLRKWQSGDSRRWIHWRSTAKSQNLMVRQFDQQGDRDLAVVLDFWCEPQLAGQQANDNAELAASAYATILTEMDHWIRGQVVTAICADETTAVSGQAQSHVFAALTEKLAVMRPAPSNGIREALAEISVNSSKGTPIIVISTRPQPEFAERDPLLDSALGRLTWITSGTPSMEELFHLDRTAIDRNASGLFMEFNKRDNVPAASGDAGQQAAADGPLAPGMPATPVQRDGGV